MSRTGAGKHTPVLVDQVLGLLAEMGDPATLDGWVVDGTLGAGGHAGAVLAAFPALRVLGIDQDPDALEIARSVLAPHGERARIAPGRISQLERIVEAHGVSRIRMVLFDLGASSMHFDRPERGFSLQHDGPLDMRMDPARTRTAADIVNHWDEADLADLFYYEGDERRSRRIARAIVEARHRLPFQRTLALAEVVAAAVGPRRGKIHPATRVFQALRRAVNEEGEELIAGLNVSERILDTDGRLVVISFHSGEDSIVRRFLTERARRGHWQLVTSKPLGPDVAERRVNPRARSALLRCARRTRAAGNHTPLWTPGPAWTGGAH
ncbi:MAG: 16S rRNA (cytosine(1402)-N(4))-methyltransferase RsmH [Planctomycetota bacterium]